MPFPDFVSTMRERQPSLTRPYVGVDMMLQRLTEFGFALGVCTNKPYELAVTILEELGIMRFIGRRRGG